MSALLAVEKFADRAVAAGISLRDLSWRLLGDCNNLAMAGLVVGLLIRHIDKVTDELDEWLRVPEIWEFEFRRTTREGAFHAQGADDADVPGRENRRANFREVASHLVTRALRNGDHSRLDALRRIGEALVVEAATRVAPPGTEVDVEAQKWLLSVRGWASLLQAEHFHSVQLDGGKTGLVYEPPEDVSEGLGRDNARLGRVMAAYGLLNRYGIPGVSSPVSAEQIASDLEVAKSLIDDPPAEDRGTVVDAPAAAAAMALHAYSRGEVVLRPHELRWAAQVLITVAMEEPDPARYSGERFDMGADRSAARAVPLLLLPCVSEQAVGASLDRDLYASACTAVARLAASSIDEVRRRLATALAALWDAPCTPRGAKRPACRHKDAFRAVIEAARMCRLGKFSEGAQKRAVKPLKGRLVAALRALHAGDMLVPRLTGPIVAMEACARSGCCVAADATALLPALLDAHRRGAAHWADKQYRIDPDDRLSVAEALLRLAGSGNDELIRHVDLFGDHGDALEHLLDDLARLATYDETHRATLRRVWPRVMDQALGSIKTDPRRRRGRSYGRAVAGIVPAPRISMDDRAIDATIAAARVGWPSIEELASRIELWLPLAAGDQWSVDALVGFLEAAPIREQADRGLPWMLRLVNEQFEVACGAFRLTSWLRSLRDAGVLGATTRPIYERIVDGLAAGGDRRAVELQQLDE